MAISSLKKAMSDAKASIKKVESGTLSDKESKKEIEIPAAELITGKQSTRNEKIRKIPIREIKPSLCKPWNYHNRDLAWLNENMCSDLISSIAKNGQMEPGLVREIDDPKYKYEIIYGVRRWYACSQIPNQKFLAQVTDASDKECMILMHIENADSKDITEFERAYSFAQQLKSGAFKNQTELSEAMGISQGIVSRMAKAAEILEYDFLSSLFPNKLDIKIKPAYDIVSLMKSSEKKSQIKHNAIEIKKRMKSGETFSTAQILSLLSGHDEAKCPKEKTVLKEGKDKILHCKRDTKGKVSFVFSPSAFKSDKDVLEAATIEALKDFIYE